MDANGRMVIACSSCAKAKVKCNKQLPCSRCASRQIVCQPRSARTSSDNSVRRTHRPLSPSKKVPAYFHGNGVSKTAEPVDRQAKGTDHQLQWTTFPHMTDNYSGNQPAHIDAPIDFDNSMQTTAQRDHTKSEAHLLDGLQGSSPDLSFPPTPSMQDARIEDLLQMNGAGWDQDDDYQFAMISDMQTALDLEVPNLAGFMSPVSSKHSLSGTPNIDIAPGMSQNFSAAWDTSPRSLAYSSGNRSPSVISSSDSWRTSYHSRSTFSHCTIREHPSVIAAQAQWRSFRCNPVMDANACPQTAKVYLEGLEQTLKNQDAWNFWDTQPQDFESLIDPKMLIEPSLGSTRDKLLAITKGFLHKSLKIHSAVVDSSTRHSSPISNSSAFINLPPPNVLEYFLRAYLCCYEPYYPSIPAGILKTNELIQLNNGSVSSLLLLLMIAQGAMATPTIEARYLTSGLTEACRISLSDDIEKNALLSSHPIVLRSALLLTNLGAWSGDKWHMNIAMGQRGMYLAMLSNAGMLEYREIRLSPRESQASLGQAWKTWKEHESRSRLVYSWVTVDQELSLFHDTAPTLSAASIHTTMPDADVLWQAKAASEWFNSLQEVSGAPHKRPFSLRDLFRRFLEAEGEVAKDCNATQLRLLLHPLQAMVCHLRQLLSCFSPSGVSHRKTSQALSRWATSARLDEAQSLLQQWYALSVRCAQYSTGFCPVSCVNLIMYHLISLNKIICFAEIERLARREGIQDVFRQFHWLKMCCNEQTQEIFFHCGQILRLARSMPQAVRPPWWAAAVYRVALISWVNSMASADTRCQANRSATTRSDCPFAIDILEPEHPSVLRYLNFQEGMPVFSKRDGSAVSLAAPGDVLTHCIEVLHEESTTRFAAGIKTRLERLAERWKK